MSCLRRALARLAFAACALGASAAPLTDRIDIRERADGGREFFHVGTGERFTPRGVNYIVLGNPHPAPALRSRSGFHNLFDPFGPNGWAANRSRVERDLPALAARGHTLVRVFLNHAATGRGGPAAQPGEPGIDPAYFDNVVEFLRLADAAGIYVTLVLGPAPRNYRPAGALIPAHDDLSAEMQPYLDAARVREMQRHVYQATEYILARAPRRAIFSIEPVQELGFRSRRPPESGKGKPLDVPPWGETRFGPWPEPGTGFKTEVRPATYNLSDGHADRYRFYRALSAFYPEQLLAALRAAPGAEDLLFTVSSAGGLVNEKLRTLGYDDRRWAHPVHPAEIDRLARRDKRVYLDLHYYVNDLPATVLENPAPVQDRVDEYLFSLGLIDRKPGAFAPGRFHQVERPRAPIILGEFGARLPTHPKTPPGGDPGLATPERALAALLALRRHSEQRGVQGWLLWLHDREAIVEKAGAPASFYTPAEFPEFHAVPLGSLLFPGQP